MRRIILAFALLLSVAASNAQSPKFQKSMEANKALFDSAKTPEDFTALAASYERIADAEKTQWLPYYYAALTNIFNGFRDEKADKDALADKADALIAKAEVLEPKNSDVVLLKSMSATLHMVVDPQNRWMKYGGTIREANETAKQFDNQNPRIYYWEGQNMFGTPTQFGGGKDKAKPLFEKALVLYKTQKTANNLYPSWGIEETEKMLEMCK